MNIEDKFYCSREPDDTEIIVIKNLLKKIDLKGYLNDNFIYVLLEEDEGGFEILSFENDYVFIASKELNVPNKMAIEYLIDKVEIDQAYNELLFDTKIGAFKKYKTITKEKLTRKGLMRQYSNYDIYASSKKEATQILNKIGVFNYLSIEDVSKKKKKTDNET